MKITIFGMGYVGVVSAACLTRDGHDVTGVDPVESKVEDLACGRSPLQEPGVAELLGSAHAAGRLRATTDVAAGLRDCEMVWICVGTPSQPDGSIHFAAVEAAARQIGGYLKATSQRPLVVLRSTVLPGATRSRLISIIEDSSGLSVGRDVHVVFHPEFLREGSAIDDFDRPPKIVVGETRAGAADPLLAIYDRYQAPRFRLTLEEAELVKYCDNLFHAVKVTFANEVGAIARAVGVDARRVAEVFCADTKLNISSRYLRPGFAFGGSCLPKDLRAILREAQNRGVPVPFLSAVTVSNTARIDSLVERVLAHRPRCVGFVGLAFKPNTDDMRESPYVIVARRVLAAGIDVRIFDPCIHPERLIGSNKALVQRALDHLERLLVRGTSDLDACDLLLVNHPIVDRDFVGRSLARGARVIDLVGIDGVSRDTTGYEGICW